MHKIYRMVTSKRSDRFTDGASEGGVLPVEQLGDLLCAEARHNLLECLALLGKYFLRRWVVLVCLGLQSQMHSKVRIPARLGIGSRNLEVGRD